MSESNAVAKTNVVIDRRNLTWLDLATLYFDATGTSARDKPNGTLMAWAKTQKHILIDDDGVHLLVTK